MRKVKSSNPISAHHIRMALLLCAVSLLATAVLVWDASETRAGVAAPAWETYTQYEATASYWLDDDLGPPGYVPQDDVDEQEHVY